MDSITTVPALPLMESFYTLQGEGYFTGTAAYFIRLAGCDVGCHWCDVKESWDVNLHPIIPIEDIVKMASLHTGRVAVVTGGEPLMHNLTILTKSLQTAGYRTHIETSGAYPLSGTWDWICLSPKKYKEALPEVCTAAHELKIIVYNQSDFEFAERHAANVGLSCKLFMQPEWSKRAEMIPKIVAYVKENPRWIISLQTHKYMDIP